MPEEDMGVAYRADEAPLQRFRLNRDGWKAGALRRETWAQFMRKGRMAVETACVQRGEIKLPASCEYAGIVHLQPTRGRSDDRHDLVKIIKHSDDTTDAGADAARGRQA